MDAVNAPLAQLGLASEDYWTSGYDDFEPDGETTTLSAVFTWPATEDDEPVHPDGLAMYWAAPSGWQWAAKRPDGSNDHPQELGVDTWSPPSAVARALADVFNGKTPTATTEQWTDPDADAVRAEVQLWRTTEQ